MLDARGHAVAGAVVERDASTDGEGVALGTTSRDAGSEREVKIVPPERLAAEAVGATVMVLTVATPEEAVPVDVRLRETAVLELEVVDVRGAALPVDEASIRNPHAVQVGALRWMVDPAHPTTMCVYPSDAELAPRILDDCGPGWHRVVVYPKSSVTGRFVDERGAPVGGARIDFHESVAGADGRFRIDGVSAGTHTFFVGRGAVPEGMILAHVRPGRDCEVGDVVLRAPRRLAGRVRDRHGHALGGAQIIARPFLNGLDWVFTTSHADGCFSMHVSSLSRHLKIEKAGHGMRIVPVDGPLEGMLPAPGRLLVAQLDEDGAVRRREATIVAGETTSLRDD